MEFNVLISDDFINICSNEKIIVKENKKIVSFLNDFEDGKWRTNKFNSFIWDNIAETALNYQERQALFDKSQQKLVAAAKNLRLASENDEIGRGSEIAEIMLYAIMKNYYKALPVVPKIYYKQNSQDNAKGADSVHIVVSGDEYSLWFGEAKFFNGLNDSSFYQITNSLYNALQTEKLKKENSIILGVRDLQYSGLDQHLIDKITKDLSPKNSIDNIKKIINIPIMVIHECDITKNKNHYNDEYIDRMREMYFEQINSYFSKQYNKLGGMNLYNLIKFHLILFPVPEKKRIVDRFMKQVKFYKEEAED
ncbi:DUF1837 domain-containing protein [Acinetobacter nosocomialis]|uniref:HamA C-terminal domain-containing protein n=1 Tax=Acinetobacter nosocomialis TaxID=106654 RepID=UPI001F39599F|nr:DUF1837 domain-containing protein [Acinetobacter nosocomialis]MCF1297448.1 DUF1837 domain-containing protein [Acinetobacter nosocomialis]